MKLKNDLSNYYAYFQALMMGMNEIFNLWLQNSNVEQT